MVCKYSLIIPFLVFTNIFYAAEVLIITHSYNRPDFIALQYRTFKKFLNDDFDFVVFNDAKDSNIASEIRQICEQYAIKCISIPQDIHHSDYPSASSRHVDCINYSLDTLGFKHDGIVIIIDSDLFLIKHFSINELMQQYEIAAVLHWRHEIYYLWPCITILNMRKLPNRETMRWNDGRINGKNVDTGEYTYYYLISNKNIRLYQMDQIYCNYNPSWDYNPNWVRDMVQAKGKEFHVNSNDVIFIGAAEQELKNRGFDERMITLVQTNVPDFDLLFNKTFLHYGSASWSNWVDHQRKTQLISGYLEDILKR